MRPGRPPAEKADAPYAPAGLLLGRREALSACPTTLSACHTNRLLLALWEYEDHCSLAGLDWPDEGGVRASELKASGPWGISTSR
jgi:hypothetical protein